MAFCTVRILGDSPVIMDYNRIMPIKTSGMTCMAILVIVAAYMAFAGVSARQFGADAEQRIELFWIMAGISARSSIGARQPVGIGRRAYR